MPTDAAPPARGGDPGPTPGPAPAADASGRRGPRLLDPWSRRGPLPLDGALERGGGIWPWLMAVLVLVGTFVAFNVVGIVVTIVLAVAGGAMDEVQPGMDAAVVQDALPAADLILGNSIGQVLGLGLPIFFFAWLHAGRVSGFLRLRRAPWLAFPLALGGLVGLLPVVGALTELNALVPLPDVFEQLEAQRMNMIRQVLESGLGLSVNLVGLAVVPALCEELAFRGYAQRQFERSVGAAGGIALSGVLFGLYHLSPAQVLPLSVLGLYLAYLTWRTGSLWPAVLVHFANNAFAVVGAEAAMRRSDLSLADVEATSWPWWSVAGGLILVAAVLYLLHTRMPQRQPAASR